MTFLTSIKQRKNASYLKYEVTPAQVALSQVFPSRVSLAQVQLVSYI